METSDVVLIVLLSAVGMYILVNSQGGLYLCKMPSKEGMEPHSWINRYKQQQDAAKRVEGMPSGVSYAKQNLNQKYEKQRKALESFDWVDRPKAAKASERLASSLRQLAGKRAEYRVRADELTPSDLMPAIVKGDIESMDRAKGKYDWVERFNTVTEGLVKGRNFLDFSDLTFQAHVNPKKKGMNVDIRGGKDVKIYPEFGLWLNRPDIPNQDADLSSAVLRGESVRNSRAARLALHGERSEQNDARRLQKYGQVA